MKHLKKQPLTNEQLRTAYEKTALHRMGIPFERAIKLEGVRIAMEGSARRSTPQTMPAATPPGIKAGIPKG